MEAKDQIVAAIKEEKAQAAIQAKAKEVREKIDAEMQKGASVSCRPPKMAGYKPETPPPFALIDPGTNVELARFIAMNGVELDRQRDFKTFAGSELGIDHSHDCKEPIDEQKYAEFKKTEYAQQNSHYEKLAIREWLRVELQRAGRPPIFGQGATG